MQGKNVVAIVCGGGPAPGINSVISAVTLEAKRNGWDVLGIYDGFSRLAKGEKNFINLDYDVVGKIHMTGGCILQMSRFNPTKKEEDLKMVVDTLTELGVTHLVTIGGDDTAFSSARVSEYAKECGRTINVVHVPKTIDNDLPLPEGIPTFGYETARSVGTTILESLMEDSKTTNNRWYFAIAMGRTAGHLALGMGKAASSTITLIPEEFSEPKIKLQRVVDLLVCSMVKRYLSGHNYGVAVIAEGVIEKIAEEDFAALGDLCLDEHGHIRYAELDLGAVLKKEVNKQLEKLGIKITIVDKEIGYEVRCAAPVPYDIDYTRSLGYAAVQFLLGGGTSALISIQDDKMVPMYFKDLRDPATGKTRVRRVNAKSTYYQIAKAYMVRLTEADLKDAELAKALGLTTEGMKEKYGYLFA